METRLSEVLRATVISLLPPLLLALVDTEASAFANGLRDVPLKVLWEQTKPGEPSVREQ